MLTFGKSRPSVSFTDVQHDESKVGAEWNQRELNEVKVLHC